MTKNKKQNRNEISIEVFHGDGAFNYSQAMFDSKMPDRFECDGEFINAIGEALRSVIEKYGGEWQK